MSDKTTLKDILEKIKTKSEVVAVQAGDIQKTSGFLKEFAEVSINGFDQSPLSDYPTNYINDFQSVLNNLDKVEQHLGSMASLASGLSFGTANAMVTLSGISTDYVCRSNILYTDFYFQFDQFLDRDKTKEQTVSAIKRLGLDSIHEGQKAISLLESAWNVHMSGVGISISSLVPLREAIAMTLKAIQKKSPQSKLKNWIQDLGAKVAFTYVTPAELQDLQLEHDLIRNQLSGSKNVTHSKEKERMLIREGTLHLSKILNIIDSNRLK